MEFLTGFEEGKGKVKGKGKSHAISCHEGTGDTLSLNSELVGGGGWLKSLLEITHRIGCWVGPRAGLDRCGKSRP